MYTILYTFTKSVQYKPIEVLIVTCSMVIKFFVTLGLLKFCIFMSLTILISGSQILLLLVIIIELLNVDVVKPLSRYYFFFLPPLGFFNFLLYIYIYIFHNFKL